MSNPVSASFEEPSGEGVLSVIVTVKVRRKRLEDYTVRLAPKALAPEPHDWESQEIHAQADIFFQHNLARPLAVF